MKWLRFCVSICCLPVCFWSAGSGLYADDSWPQFRGADATGVVTGTDTPPDTWSLKDNIAWKSDIPGRGWSSPVVTGGRVFLTTVVNDGKSEDPKKGLYFGGNRPAPKSKHHWWVMCLDLKSGETLWKREVNTGQPSTAIHVKNSFASETPVTDGEHVYVVFGGVGIFCFDLEGNEVWKRPLAPRKTRYGWGSSASPVLHGENLFFVNDNDEQSYLAAYNKRTGEELWRKNRKDKSNWSTPYIWKHERRTEIIVPATGRVMSYDLAGNVLWSFKGMSSITIATPYVHDGLLIVSSGYVGDSSRPLYAIRPGATGDITLPGDKNTNEFIAWCQPTGGPYNPSTLAYKGIVYVLHDRGLMAAYDAKTGAEIYSKQRIRGARAFTSSPWAYDGKLFCLSENGQTFVIKAGKTFELLNTNSLGDDDMGMASPAVVRNRLILRTAARVYCISN